MKRPRVFESLESRRLLCGADCNDEGVLLGDANRDGEVAFTDFLAMVGNFGGAADFAGGDFNADGTVDFNDFLLLAQNFGLVSTPSTEFHEFLVPAIADGNTELLNRVADELVKALPDPSTLPEPVRGSCYPADGEFAAMSGDYNLDCMVNEDDLSLWIETYSSTELLFADGDGDGSVGFEDYMIWQDNLSPAEQPEHSGLLWSWSAEMVNPNGNANTARVTLNVTPDADQLAAADSLGLVGLVSFNMTIDLVGDIDGSTATVTTTSLIPDSTISPFGDGAVVTRGDNLNPADETSGTDYYYIVFLNSAPSFESLTSDGSVSVLQFDVSVPDGFEIGTDNSDIVFTAQLGGFPTQTQFGEIGTLDEPLASNPLYGVEAGDPVTLSVRPPA